MTRHSVRLFARYAELLGSSDVEVELPDHAQVKDLVAALRKLPGGVLLPENPFVAINLSSAKPTAPIQPGDELALLPPMAGG